MIPFSCNSVMHRSSSGESATPIIFSPEREAYSWTAAAVFSGRSFFQGLTLSRMLPPLPEHPVSSERAKTGSGACPTSRFFFNSHSADSLSRTTRTLQRRNASKARYSASLLSRGPIDCPKAQGIQPAFSAILIVPQ